MAKIKGTVKWFSNRKGFGFLAPTSDNSPTKEEIFVHHSSLVMQEGAYKTLAENAEVEFEVETDQNGKLKAVNVTQVGGEPLTPPPREKRIRKPREGGSKDGEEAPAPKVSSEEKQADNGGGKDNKRNGRKGKPRGKKPPASAISGEPRTESRPDNRAPREPPFHSVIPEDIKTQIADKGLKLIRNTVDLAMGGARIKLGQGGYASLVDTKCIVGEGTFTCDEKAKVTFAWERCLELQGGDWNIADISKLVPSISLLEDDVKPVDPDETPEALWGADKPDPKDKFAEHGFKMKKVILTRPKGGGRGRRIGSKPE